jgi:transposase-like protein
VERGIEAIDRRGGDCARASVCEVARQRNVVPGQIYRWQRELRDMATGFTEVVVATEPSPKGAVGAAAVQIEFGGDICVRMAAR